MPTESFSRGYYNNGASIAGSFADLGDGVRSALIGARVGGAAALISNACTTSRALRACPSPEVPSHSPRYHLAPQVFPSLPPEQAAAAASADARMTPFTFSAVSGTITVVFASQRAR